MATTQQIDSTTQQFLDIYDITNDLVILKDGTASLVITVDAMNFGLLAEEEQDSIMYAYAGLLNSLNYPIQIVIKSQTKDVTGYLQLLKDQEDKASSRLQQQRIMKYREFVSNLIRERNVLDKKFYVAIPAKPLELGLVPISSVVPGQSQTDISTVDKSMVIEKAKSILEPKRDHLIAQFARIGLYSRQLNTQEIIQLFYQSYNPESFEGQGMGDSKSYTTPMVTASVESVGSGMNNSVALGQEQIPVAPVESSTPATFAEPQVAPTVNEVASQQEINSDILPNSTEQPSKPISPTPYTATGYTPTQMINNPVAPVEPATPTTFTEPQVAPTVNEASATPELTTITPPLTPNIPKETSDTVIPQEIEIQISRPNSTNTQTTQSGSSETEITPTQPKQVVDALPPLPEIQ